MARLWTLALLAMVATSATAAEPDSFGKARQLWQTGKYAEAIEAYDTLRLAPAHRNARDQGRIALGRAECLASQGETDRAIVELVLWAAWPRADPNLWARLADLQFSRGRWELAEAAARRALKANPDHLAARWVVARLEEARGNQQRSNELCKWIVDRRNDKRK
jgi:tetratricopeptide (TPR) repeat protein